MARRPRTDGQDAVVADPWAALIAEREAHTETLKQVLHYCRLTSRPMCNGTMMQSPCRICAPWSPQQRRAYGPCPCTFLPRRAAEELARLEQSTLLQPIDLGVSASTGT